MREEEKRIRRLLPQMDQYRGRGSINQYEGGDNGYNQGYHSGQFYFNNQAQAETTLSRYGGGDKGGA